MCKKKRNMAKWEAAATLFFSVAAPAPVSCSVLPRIP